MNKNKERVTPVYYPKTEELFSAISHGLGALFGVFALGYMLALSIRSADAAKIAASAIYGSSLLLAYAFSTLSHALTPRPAKQVFRILEHSSIFLLIAGTYTPITLLVMGGTLGWTICAIQWAIAALGITLNSVALNKFKNLSLIIYILMGWLIIIAAYPLLQQMASGDFLYLLSGGIFYTGGAIFYRLNRPGSHAIWHIFALIGSILQFSAIQSYL